MVTSVDDTADVSQSVINFQVDLSGINRKRPALTSYATTGLGSSVLIGLYVWQTWLIGVTQDRKLWAMSQTAPTVWQALSDATAATKLDGGLRPVFAEDGLRVVIVGGGAIQQWQGVGLSSRLGGGPAATHIAAIGARFVANNTSASQEFDWSNIGDGSHATWDALAFSNADARPDPVVGIFENLRELHVFGSSTDQIYSVGSDPLNPFDFVAATNVGLAAPYSVVRLDQAFAFLDDKRRFVISDGRTETFISHQLDKDLRQLATVSDCWGYREDFEQFANIVWTFPVGGKTYVFDTAKSTWSERRYYSNPFQLNMPQGCHVFWPALNLHLIGSTTAADVLYRLSSASRDDLGGPMVCERYTGWQDCGTLGYKRDGWLDVTVRRGTVPLGSIESALEVRCRDDGGPWSDFEFIRLGQPGDSDQQIRIRLGGCFYRRQYHFRYSGTDDFALVSAEQDFQDLDAEEEAA